MKILKTKIVTNKDGDMTECTEWQEFQNGDIMKVIFRPFMTICPLTEEEKHIFLKRKGNLPKEQK